MAQTGKLLPMNETFHVRACQDNTDMLNQIHRHLKKKSPGDLLLNCSKNELANTAMMLGLLELSRRHGIKLK
jgi:hypothetical protein